MVESSHERYCTRHRHWYPASLPTCPKCADCIPAPVVHDESESFNDHEMSLLHEQHRYGG
jgi:hypothetical protein